MILYKNACDGIYNSLDIRFTKKCDNNCLFCIEKNGVNFKEETSVKTLVNNTIKTGIKNILILGGEPLLNIKKVLEYVKGIRDYAETIYITTSLPNTINDNMNTMIEILSLIDGLNVSIQHHDYKVNNDILQATSKHNRISLLSKIIKNTDKPESIRVSINLVKGSIDTKKELYTTLDVLKNIGCKSIKINELQHTPDSYVSFEDITGIKLKSAYSNGCQTKVNLIEGVHTIVKRSCFLVEDSKQASFKDLIKIVLRALFFKPRNMFRVMYEDGTIQKSWIKE